MERWLKILVSGKDPDGLSAIDTDTYFHRFCEKMEDLFHLPDDDEWTALHQIDPRSRRLTPVYPAGSGKMKSPKALSLPHGEATFPQASALMTEDDSDGL